EFENFAEWVLKFSSFPLVQLIDLDAAMGRAPNSELIRFFVNQLPCQVGGGIRTLEAARAALDLGAKRVILGSALIQNGAINVAFARPWQRNLDRTNWSSPSTRAAARLRSADGKR